MQEDEGENENENQKEQTTIKTRKSTKETNKAIFPIAEPEQ